MLLNKLIKTRLLLNRCIFVGILSVILQSAIAENMLILTSSSFAQGDMLPKLYTCHGKDIFPSLQWAHVPIGTKTLVLIMDDPDAPGGIWDHWVVFNIPETSSGIESGKPLPVGAIQGENSWGSQGYRGPCPPRSLAHRYFIKLYALDNALTLDSNATKQQVEAAMKSHILGEAQLMAKYQSR